MIDLNNDKIDNPEDNTQENEMLRILRLKSG